MLPERPTGTEPRGIAVTPNGTFLYVANHTGDDSAFEGKSRKHLGRQNGLSRIVLRVMAGQNGRRVG
jgi:DNA-binding beta-propeller fold protein YncE